MELVIAQMPTIDGTYILQLASRVLHIVGAIVLIGGVAYLRKVVVPAAASGEGDIVDRLFAGRRGKWAMWVGVSVLLLLATGIYNYVGVIKANPDLPGAYHGIFLAKFLLALVVFFLASILAGKTSAADNFRNSAKKWFTICLVCGLIVVLLASVLRSLHLPSPMGEITVEEPNTEN